MSKLDPLTPQYRPLILMYLVVPSFWRNNCWAVVDASSTRCAADLPSFQIRIKRMFKFTLLLLLFLDCQDLDAHLTYKFLLSWTYSLWVYLHTLTLICFFQFTYSSGFLRRPRSWCSPNYKFLLSWMWVYLHTLTLIWYFPVYLEFSFSKKATKFWQNLLVGLKKE